MVFLAVVVAQICVAAQGEYGFPLLNVGALDYISYGRYLEEVSSLKYISADLDIRSRFLFQVLA